MTTHLTPQGHPERRDWTPPRDECWVWSHTVVQSLSRTAARKPTPFLNNNYVYGVVTKVLSDGPCAQSPPAPSDNLPVCNPWTGWNAQYIHKYIHTWCWCLASGHLCAWNGALAAAGCPLCGMAIRYVFARARTHTHTQARKQPFMPPSFM